MIDLCHIRRNTVDGLEIPFPTTWDVLETLLVTTWDLFSKTSGK